MQLYSKSINKFALHCIFFFFFEKRYRFILILFLFSTGARVKLLALYFQNLRYVKDHITSFYPFILGQPK